MQFQEWREEDDFRKLKDASVRDLPEYRCHSCNTFVHAEDRVDTSESDRIGSFHYGGETEWE